MYNNGNVYQMNYLEFQPDKLLTEFVKITGSLIIPQTINRTLPFYVTAFWVGYANKNSGIR